VSTVVRASSYSFATKCLINKRERGERGESLGEIILWEGGKEKEKRRLKGKASGIYSLAAGRGLKGVSGFRSCLEALYKVAGISAREKGVLASGWAQKKRKGGGARVSGRWRGQK